MGRPDVYRRIVSIFCFIGYVWHVICLKAKKTERLWNRSVLYSGGEGGIQTFSLTPIKSKT